MKSLGAYICWIVTPWHLRILHLSRCQTLHARTINCNSRVCTFPGLRVVSHPRLRWRRCTRPCSMIVPSLGSQIETSLPSVCPTRCWPNLHRCKPSASLDCPGTCTRTPNSDNLSRIVLLVSVWTNHAPSRHRSSTFLGSELQVNSVHGQEVRSSAERLIRLLTSRDTTTPRSRGACLTLVCSVSLRLAARAPWRLVRTRTHCR